MNIKLPKTVCKIIEKLNQSGYQAYVVGGCVRDSLLGKEPKDWDITTDATPNQIKAVFDGYELINNNGEKHGTVTVRLDNENYEITTYRIDGDYSDGRHPNSVSFTRDIAEDLARRDFTINAMAYNETDGLVDPFDGQLDLKLGRLRCVGLPERRFEEDALRILRGLRFASVYNLIIETETREAMHKMKDSVNKVSKERIQVEFVKMVSGIGFTRLIRQKDLFDVFCIIIPQMRWMWEFEQDSRYHKHNLLEHTLSVVDNVPFNNYKLKITALLHDIGKATKYERVSHFPECKRFVGHAEESYKYSMEILKTLKFSNDIQEEINFLIRYHDYNFSEKRLEASIKKFIPLIPEKNRDLIFDELILLRKADRVDHIYTEPVIDLDLVSNTYKKIIEEDSCFSIKQLAINGIDLMELGIPAGPQIKLVLNWCVDMVINGIVLNTKEELINAVKLNTKNCIF